MNEMTAVGRGDWPPITMVIFRNYQWGAEKRNTTLWYDDNFVGTELDLDVQYAKIAEACGLKGKSVLEVGCGKGEFLVQMVEYGAGKGIGRAIALAYAEAGANIVCAARTQADLDSVVESAQALGVEALGVACDVSE